MKTDRYAYTVTLTWESSGSKSEATNTGVITVLADKPENDVKDFAAIVAASELRAPIGYKVDSVHIQKGQ